MKTLILILLSLIIISIAYVMVIDAQAQDCPGHSCDPLPPQSEGCEHAAPGQNPHCDDPPGDDDDCDDGEDCPDPTPDPEDQPTPEPKPEPERMNKYYIPIAISKPEWKDFPWFGPVER